MFSGITKRITRSMGRKPSLEIHIPISPTPTFFNMVQCFVLSLRHFGGSYKDAPVILTIGDVNIDHGVADRYPWLPRLGVEIRWVPEEAFRRYSYYATGDTRFNHAFKSDVVLFLDADILVAAPFDEMIHDVHERGVVAGMIAPASPLQFCKSPTTWHDIYKFCELEQTPELRYEHPGWPYYFSSDAAYQYSPIYYNFGVVCAPATVMKQLATCYFSYLLKLRELTDSDLVAQMALTIAIIKLGIPAASLPVRYNFPNHPMLEALHGPEMPLAKLLHMKENHQIEKMTLFSDPMEIKAALERTDLRGINQIAQRVIAETWAEFTPTLATF